MAKQRPEEPKPKKTLLMSVAEFFKGIQNPFRNVKSPLENEKIKKYTDKVQSMDKKQGRKLLAGIVGGFLLVIYLILVHVYSDRFIDGTIINGIDVGSKTPEQVEALLEKRIEELGLEKESYEWYLDLRRYGGVIHSGYGLGFERLVMYLTGISNIRDVLPFPRTTGSADL